MRLFSTEKLSQRKEMTPDGYLCCYDVPISRTGIMIYGPGETPISPGPDGLIRVEREADEVFREQSISSFLGKPVTDDHPREEVTPDNWRDLAKGFAINPRRGPGIHDDVVLADLIITCPEMIRSIMDKDKTEVSCGYDCDYDELEPGRGRQRNIIGNHIALVEKGRCGPRCAIGDKETISHDKEFNMKKSKIWGRIKEAVRLNDASGVKDLIDAARNTSKNKGGPVIIHNHLANDEMPEGLKKKIEGEKEEDELPPQFKEHMKSADARFHDLETKVDAIGETLKKWAEQEGGEKEHAGDDEEEPLAHEEHPTDEANKKIEGSLEEEAPPGTGDRARKAKDSAYLVDSYQHTVALAEILAPGIRIPTFDRAANPRKSFQAICGLRRQALDLAYVQPETRGLIDEVLAGKTLDTKKMSCDAVRTIFRSAAALKKNFNNNRSGRDSGLSGPGGGLGIRSTIKSPADLNKIHAEFYKNH